MFDLTEGILLALDFFIHIGRTILDGLGLSGRTGLEEFVCFRKIENMDQHSSALGNIGLRKRCIHQIIVEPIHIHNLDIFDCHGLKVVLQNVAGILLITVGRSLDLGLIIVIPVVSPLGKRSLYRIRRGLFIRRIVPREPVVLNHARTSPFVGTMKLMMFFLTSGRYPSMT